MLQRLPRDVLLGQLPQWCPLGTSLRLVRTCTQFWKLRNHFIDKDEVDFCKQMIANKQFTKGLCIAIENRDFDLMSIFIDRVGWHFAPMASAAKIGDMEMMKFFAKQTPSKMFFLSLFEAAQFGHKEIVEYLLDNGCYWINHGMYCAALGGHLDIVLLCIAKGATDFVQGVYHAASGGHKHIVEYFLQLKAPITKYSLRCAARGGSLEILELLLRNFNGQPDWLDMMSAAIEGYNQHMVEYILQKYGTPNAAWWEAESKAMYGRSHVENFLWRHWRLRYHDLFRNTQTKRCMTRPAKKGISGRFSDFPPKAIPCADCNGYWELWKQTVKVGEQSFLINAVRVRS